MSKGVVFPGKAESLEGLQSTTNVLKDEYERGFADGHACCLGNRAMFAAPVETLALEREWQARVDAARAEGLEVGRALMALHAAVARKEGRAEGLRMAADLARSMGVRISATEIEALGRTESGE